MRAAAWDTGAIKGLYTTDRGFTITVATQAAGWETQVRQEKGEEARALFEAQLEAYRLALDAAMGDMPISEAWIRHLHEIVTAAQDDYTVHTATGDQAHPLPKGEYKHHPNHVLQADGRVFAHAPVGDVASEMGRLIEQLRSDDFTVAHPVEQASYAHYALVRIHPFADGNGRIARALASVYTLRAASLPVTVYSDEKPRYLDPLEAADEGERDAFATYLFGALAETARETATGLRLQLTGSEGPHEPPREDAHLRNAVLDAGAYALLEAAESALLRVLEIGATNGARAGLAHVDPPELPTGHRVATSEGFKVLVGTVGDAGGRVVEAQFHVLIATSPDALDRFSLATGQLDHATEGFSEESLIPRVTERSRARLDTWARNVAEQLRAQSRARA